MTGHKPCKVTKKINMACQKPKKVRRATAKENGNNK